jgi:hypothetical protein
MFCAGDFGFFAFEACTLARIDAAGADALADAALLVGTSLIDGHVVLRNRRLLLHNGCSLRKTNGGSQCEKSDAKQREFHGCISLRGGGCV